MMIYHTYIICIAAKNDSLKMKNSLLAEEEIRGAYLMIFDEN